MYQFDLSINDEADVVIDSTGDLELAPSESVDYMYMGIVFLIYKYEYDIYNLETNDEREIFIRSLLSQDPRIESVDVKITGNNIVIPKKSLVIDEDIII